MNPSVSRRQTLLRTATNIPRISYLEWPGNREPIILLHGLADHGGVWQSLGNTLASQYHAIAPDLRGHGNSSKPKQGYTSPEIIADLQALMQHLGITRAHILGHSWAGKVACLWATQFPEQCRSLILVDPFFINALPSAFKLTFPLLYRVLPFLAAMGPFPSYEAAVQKAQTLKQYRGWSSLQKQVFEQSIEQKKDGTWGSKFTVAARNQIFEDVMLVSGLTKSLQIPTLFIQPQAGLNRTQWQLKPYQTYLENLKIVQVPGNHWAFLVEPEPFNQTVLDFLQNLPNNS
ncbi:MAG: alpha/beta hydrolase [Jaaginema sp. PMC 1079.18]|nr:alpha/beta hydrolase [Jaaginema sp. PMC 1080.18]MEC4851068.1 alpha/beta hydrolase [Jaaginema sp. PMC 1079.18]MEC4866984.1 alpha/beta hydrolase [Jaaginema sp. PMC 1078.18]